jgi:hypothetical protein
MVNQVNVKNNEDKLKILSNINLRNAILHDRSYYGFNPVQFILDNITSFPDIDKIIELLNLIMETKILTFDENIPVFVPPYNLQHLNMSCHFNAALNAFVSMNKVVYDIITHDNSSLKQLIINSISPLNKYLKLIRTYSKSKSININVMSDAETDLRELVLDSKSVSDRIAWPDRIDGVCGSDLRTLINSQRKEYLILNNESFNIFFNNEQNTVHNIINTSIDSAYSLISIILFDGAHYSSATFNGNKWVERNDLFPYDLSSPSLLSDLISDRMVTTSIYYKSK